MKKRLRKKLHVGEFKELGFEFNILFAPGTSEEALAESWDSLTDLTMSRSLQLGGGWDSERASGFISADGRASALESDRDAVGKWCTDSAVVREHTVGPLVDAWH